MNGPSPWVLERWPGDPGLASRMPEVATTATVRRTATSVATVGVTAAVVAIGVSGGAARVTTAGSLGRRAADVALGVVGAKVSGVSNEDRGWGDSLEPIVSFSRMRAEHVARKVCIGCCMDSKVRI